MGEWIIMPGQIFSIIMPVRFCFDHPAGIWDHISKRLWLKAGEVTVRGFVWQQIRSLMPESWQTFKSSVFSPCLHRFSTSSNCCSILLLSEKPSELQVCWVFHLELFQKTWTRTESICSQLKCVRDFPTGKLLRVFSRADVTFVSAVDQLGSACCIEMLHHSWGSELRSAHFLKPS